jgi:hypothetical protein
MNRSTWLPVTAKVEILDQFASPPQNVAWGAGS